MNLDHPAIPESARQVAARLDAAAGSETIPHGLAADAYDAIVDLCGRLEMVADVAAHNARVAARRPR